MKYQDFKKKVRKFPFFSTSQLLSFADNEQNLKNLLTLWCKQGVIIRLKRGIYTLNEEDRLIHFSRIFIANQLVSPSYVSMEYALSYYGMIPEKVVDVTSVTTKKTVVLNNYLGTFRYQHIKNESFSGFKVFKDENGFNLFIAEPEKAIVDFFYLNLEKFKSGDKNIFGESYRLQNLKDLNREKLVTFTKSLKSKKLIKVIDCFWEYVKSEA